MLAALLLLAPVALNGRPTAFFDTMDYLHEGEASLALAHVRLPGLNLTPPTPEAREQAGVWRSIRASRSAAYGMFVYLTFRLGGLWLTAALQALAAASMIYAFVRATCGRARATFWKGIAAVTLATALPFYCGFAMPDVFAAIGVLALTALVIGGDRLRPRARAAVFVAAVACSAMHTSHVLTMLARAPCAFFLRSWLRRRIEAGWPAAAVALAVAAVAIVMYVGFTAAVRAGSGQVLRSPPFMSARLLMDGPGRRYLARACADGRRPYTLCDYKARRLTVGDEILWSRSRRVGVFGTVDAPTRQRLSEEDRAFALGVVRDDPLGVGVAVAANVASELVSLRIEDLLRGPEYFLDDGFWRRTALPWVAPGAATCARRPAACTSRLAASPMLVWHLAAFAFASAFLGWRLTRRDVREACRTLDRADAETPRLVGTTVLLLAALLVNAVICGALSGPYARYQARIAWLAVMMAVVVASRLGLRSPRIRLERPAALRLDPGVTGL